MMEVTWTKNLAEKNVEAGQAAGDILRCLPDEVSWQATIPHRDTWHS